MPSAVTLTISLLAALPGAPHGASVGGMAAAIRGAVTSGTDEFPTLLVLFALAGVVAVAMIGAGVLLARRNLSKDPPPTAMAQAAAALERRSVRRSKVRLAEDPIVAAMRIDDARRRRTRPRPRAVRESDDRTATPLT